MKKYIVSLISVAMFVFVLAGCASDPGESTQKMPADSTATAKSPAPGAPVTPGVPPK